MKTFVPSRHSHSHSHSYGNVISELTEDPTFLPFVGTLAVIVAVGLVGKSLMQAAAEATPRSRGR